MVLSNVAALLLLFIQYARFMSKSSSKIVSITFKSLCQQNWQEKKVWMSDKENEKNQGDGSIFDVCQKVETTERSSRPVANPKKLRESFISLAESLLVSLCEVFPECLNTQSVLQLFQSIVKGNEDLEDSFIRTCGKVFKENAEALHNRQAEGLFKIAESIDHLKEIKLREKWEDPDFTPESREHLWQYMVRLKSYSEIYCVVPNKVLHKLETTASSFAEQLTQGTFDLKNLDLGSLGSELMSEMSPDELAGFESKIPDIFQAITALGAGNNGIPGLDINSICKQMATLSGETNATSGIDLSSLQSFMQDHTPKQSTNDPSFDLNQMMQTLTPFLQALQNQTADSKKAANNEKHRKKIKKKKG